MMTWRQNIRKLFEKNFELFSDKNISPQNEINLWFLLGSKFIFFASQVNFIYSFIERFNAKECLGVASLPPTHKFVAKFWLIAINTVFQVYFLKANWNWFMKSPCSFTDWTFVFSFSVNICFSQVVAGLVWGSKYVDTVGAFHFSTYVAERRREGFIII